MAASEAILAAVAKLDMLELTSRIMTNPERNAPRASVADIYALARATEALWGVVIDARLLMSALDRGDGQLAARQLTFLREQLAFMPDPIPAIKHQENTDGNR